MLLASLVQWLYSRGGAWISSLHDDGLPFTCHSIMYGWVLGVTFTARREGGTSPLHSACVHAVKGDNTSECHERVPGLRVDLSLYPHRIVAGTSGLSVLRGSTQYGHIMLEFHLVSCSHSVLTALDGIRISHNQDMLATSSTRLTLLLLPTDLSTGETNPHLRLLRPKSSLQAPPGNTRHLS